MLLVYSVQGQNKLRFFAAVYCLFHKQEEHETRSTINSHTRVLVLH